MADRRRAVSIPGPTQAKARRIRSELASDLTSAFKLMEQDVGVLVRKASRDGWTVEQLMLEIDELLGGL
jgi:hypothetical protein